MIKAKIQAALEQSDRYVFLPADFAELGAPTQVRRALSALVHDGALIRVGYGVYTTARINPLTGKPMPTSPKGAGGVIVETLERLDVPYEWGRASCDYLSGRSTQIPAKLDISVPPSLTRKLAVGSARLNA